MNIWWIAQLNGLLIMRRDLRPWKKKRSFLGSIEEELLDGIDADIEAIIADIEISELTDLLKSESD